MPTVQKKQTLDEIYNLEVGIDRVINVDDGNIKFVCSGGYGFIVDGNLDLTGELRLDNNKPLYLDTANTKSLKWNPTNSRFEFNDNMFAATVFGVEAYFDEILYLGHSTTNAGEIDFWNGATAYDKILKYDDVNSRFEFNDSLKVNGKLTVTGLIDPTGLALDPQATTPFTTEKGIWQDNADNLRLTGNQKFGDDKKLIFGDADNVETSWDTSYNFFNIACNAIGIGDTTGWDRHFWLDDEYAYLKVAGDSFGIMMRNFFDDTYFSGIGVGINALGNRMQFAATNSTLYDYRLAMLDSLNSIYFKLGRTSLIWESNADINLIGSVLKVDGTQVVGAQQSHIIDADGTLADITTKFNTLLNHLEAHGLLAST